MGQAITRFGGWLNDHDGRRALILVTDGRETCGRNPEERAAAIFRSGVPVYVIGLWSTEEERTALDGIANAGGTRRAVIANNENDVERAINEILEPMLRESCNGHDDDCDGRIDEGFGIGEPCGTGAEGICGSGRVQCDGGGQNVFRTQCPKLKSAMPSTMIAMELWMRIARGW